MDRDDPLHDVDKFVQPPFVGMHPNRPAMRSAKRSGRGERPIPGQRG